MTWCFQIQHMHVHLMVPVGYKAIRTTALEHWWPEHHMYMKSYTYLQVSIIAIDHVVMINISSVSVIFADHIYRLRANIL